MLSEQSREKNRTSRSQLLNPDIPHTSLSRSPHPYYRRGEGIDGGRDADTKSQHEASHSASRSDSTESGTEADDERGTILRSLPAPPARSRKGLKGTTPHGLSPAVTPPPSPPATLQSAIQETFDYFGAAVEWDTNKQDATLERRTRESYICRKRGEILRRATETVLLCAIGFLSFLSAKKYSAIDQWTGEMITFLVLPPIIYASYPCRKVQLAYARQRKIGEALATGLHLPSRFDPGPLIYPVALPFIVALSLEGQSDPRIAVNIVCGITSIPTVVTAIWHRPLLVQHCRWVLAILPLHATSFKSTLFGNQTPFSLKVGAFTSSREHLVLIPPLHEALKSVLYYTTTSSLDPAELDLLTTAMINILLLGASPQAGLLNGLLWVGGLSIFICCRQLLVWEVELARIPKWKFAKRRNVSIAERLGKFFSDVQHKRPAAVDSSDDEVDLRAKLKPLLRVKTLGMPRQIGKTGVSATDALVNGTTAVVNNFQRPGRRSTISNLDPKTRLEVETRARHTARQSSLPRSKFLALTAREAKSRKYVYAIVVYLLVILIALVPVRIYVSQNSLSNYEPFGWAIGYLFGNISAFVEIINRLALDRWIPVPVPSQSESVEIMTLYNTLSSFAIPAGNLRLILCAYCLTVLLIGVVVVLSLAPYAEVDTRRKGFHGVMVAMLLPTIFVDPCFFSLALSLILAIFLLLDLFRASQLPPISRPLTKFLAPYVDGRDHRGPVIISHIFLLIGCAIPLWLSLAGLPRTGSGSWRGWDTPDRNLSMVSGVICVGMGDAAASLIGRRYGKTKWYWGGGKSLEGSLAFALAVTLGLMFGYIWLRVLGWRSWDDLNLTWALTKSLLAGSGASVLETVLTAANDNVVVPIGLWLLVRGLEI